MRLLFESWRTYLKEMEEYRLAEQEGYKFSVAKGGEVSEEPEDVSDLSSDRILDISKDLDSGFCDFNPLINQYAQNSPEGMAEMLIFVVATMQTRWSDVMERFPILMAWIEKHDGLLIPDLKYKNEKGKMVYELPKGAGIVGNRLKVIDFIWRNRESIYESLMKPINKYNNSSGLEKEEALFDVYMSILGIKGFGLPKAAFAVQLIIGRLGCIDSINMNLYQGLGKEAQLLVPTTNKKGETSLTFKGMGGYRRPNKAMPDSKIMAFTTTGVKLAKKYIEFLQEIAKQTKTADISRKLWDSWVEMVALKSNAADDLAVKMPNGKIYRVPNDYYSKKTGAPRPSLEKYLSKYGGTATGKDISREHDPREIRERKLTESQKIWSNYFYGVLRS